MLSVEIVMKTLAIIFPVILSACVTANRPVAKDNVEIIYAGQSERPEKEYFAVVMEFGLVNRSSKEVCVFEDIFINDLSPHVVIKPANDRGSDLGIPYPPKSSKITRLRPGEKKNFSRVVSYRQARIEPVSDYRVAVDLSFCEDGARFKADTIVHLNSPAH